MKKFAVVIIFSLICLGAIFIYQSARLNDDTLRIVFCATHNGSAVFIKSPSNKKILIDAGADNSILSCLNKNLPFWDTQIDLLTESTPRGKDFTGISIVIDRYKVLSFASVKDVNSTKSYHELLKNIAAQKIPYRALNAGGLFKFKDKVSLEVLSPQPASPEDSLILNLLYDNFSLLLTGDAGARALEEVAARVRPKIDILQVPGQGSASSLNKSTLDLLAPKLAIITAGSDNPSGYPDSSILNILKNSAVKTLRTDRAGEISIISNGDSFWSNSN